MLNADLLQWPGALLGLIGALLVPQQSPRARRWGFGVWIASNICLIIFAVHTAAWALVGMYAFYGITSVWGWRNNSQPKE